MRKLVLATFTLAFALFSINAQENQQPQPVQKNGKAVFKVDNHDFGTIKEEGGLATYTFDFTNKGTDPLILKNVSTTCGCTIPEWSKEPILPNKKGTVKVSFNPSGRPGTFERTITIYSDGNPGVQTVKIKGVVEAKPVAPPAEKK
jgi:hypothetical protein